MELKLNQFEIKFRISACFHSDFWHYFILSFGDILLPLKLNQYEIALSLHPASRSNPNPSEKVRKKVRSGVLKQSECESESEHSHFLIQKASTLVSSSFRLTFLN
jgi:hypothetical protein